MLQFALNNVNSHYQGEGGANNAAETYPHNNQ